MTDDKSGLIKWSAAQAVRGLVARPDLFEVARTKRDDDDHIKQIASKATEAAGSDVAANTGTSIHFWTEQMDLGQEGLDEMLPAEFDTLLEAYRTATAGLDVLDVELFVVCDELQVAGTLDRLVRLPDGAVVVADLKTGKATPKYPLSTAIQTAVYAHSERYDPETGFRTALHPDLDVSRTILIHAPVPDMLSAATVTLWELDATWGWYGALLAKRVQEWRKQKPIKKYEPKVAV